MYSLRRKSADFVPVAGAATSRQNKTASMALAVS
jgi:hypothetical protein